MLESSFVDEVGEPVFSELLKLDDTCCLVFKLSFTPRAEGLKQLDQFLVGEVCDVEVLLFDLSRPLRDLGTPSCLAIP